LGDYGIGNSYYKVQAPPSGGSELVVTARMDCLTYTDGWAPKIDECLGTHYLDETYLRQASLALETKIAKLHADLGGAIKPVLWVDWSSATSDSWFLRQRESTRKSTIDATIDSVIQKGIWDSEGLLSFCREHPEIQIAAIVVKLTSGSIDYGVGNSYYRLDVSDGPAVTITVRMDCVTYTDGWKTKLNAQIHALKSVRAMSHCPPRSCLLTSKANSCSGGHNAG
jgi:hypothetical protein